MYICLKNTEHTEEIINTFVRNNIAVDVSRYDVTSYIMCELKDYGYAGYVSISRDKVVINSAITLENLIEIDFSEIDTIYDLN